MTRFLGIAKRGNLFSSEPDNRFGRCDHLARSEMNSRRMAGAGRPERPPQAEGLPHDEQQGSATLGYFGRGALSTGVVENVITGKTSGMCES